MRYVEFRPDPSLEDFVECFWLAEDGPPRSIFEPEAVAPDGGIEWIFHRSAPYRQFDDRGNAVLQPSSFFVGAASGPIRLAPSGRVETLGIRFRPAGAAAFLPFSLDALTDRVVPASDLWDHAGRRVVDDALDAADAETARRLLERFLLEHLDDSFRLDPLRSAVRHLLRRGGNVPVAELAALIGWTPRHLEREFRRRVGLSPKRLSRIARFQNLLRLSGRFPEHTWAELSAAAGYADQAHMIRDHRAFAGVTPSRRRTVAGDLARHFVEPSRLDELLLSPFPPEDVAFLQDPVGRAL